ncbi:MTRF1L release factor glutamine methyltransferase isoform X1 [Cynoglossus semilaevis]|uniref:MTRF1L release factor glutamine methyltransferase isoform X1 n=1 Tax=Cynoglossus semilaevis TaxID=244447 RepID=UPI000495D8F5|nr:hemK methyltransferase family member 1 isoform X1 [Cynoglossus semilaevis]
MWRRSLSAGCRCFGFGSIGAKRRGQFHSLHTCSPPALPVGRITALQALEFWKKHFEESGVTEPDLSSHYIVAHSLGGKTIESLEQRKLTEFLSREKTEQIWKLCTKRLSRMPVQYVIQEWDFRDLTLTMRPPVFIPRPETEELVELVLTDLKNKPSSGDTVQTCLEVGCGSGAVSLSLLSSCPQLQVVALDRSQEAVELTKENASRLKLQDRIQIHHLDFMTEADEACSRCSPVSVLVSNPPYLFSDDVKTLEPEILRFEDPFALDGGSDGLTVIKQILTVAPKILSDRGGIYLEVDPRHPPLIQQWVEANVAELRYVETRPDINSRPRFCVLQKKQRELDVK